MSRKFLANVGIVSVMSATQLVLQFALQTVLADRFGASAVMDGFNAVITIPNVLTTIIMVTLGFSMIPELARQFEADHKSAWRTSASLLLWLSILGGALSFLILVANRSLVETLFHGMQQEASTAAVESLEILSWILALNIVSTTCTSIYHARHRFFWAALLSVLAAVMNLTLAFQWSRAGIVGYAWSIIVTNIAYTVLLTIPLAVPLASNICLWTPGLSRIVVSWWPLLLGGVYVRIDPIIDRIVASTLDEGSIAHLGYAQRFITAITMVVTGSILTVIFPKLATGDPSALKSNLASKLPAAFSGLIAVILPVCIGGIWFAVPVVSDLLQRGEFLASDSEAVGGLVQILLIFFAFAALNDLIGRALITLGYSKLFAILSAVGVTFGFALKFLLVDQFGVRMIATASVLAFGIVFVLSLQILRRQVDLKFDSAFVKDVCKSIMASCIACLVAQAIVSMIEKYGTLIAAPIAASVYLVLLYASQHTAAQLIGQRLMPPRRPST